MLPENRATKPKSFNLRGRQISPKCGISPLSRFGARDRGRHQLADGLLEFKDGSFWECSMSEIVVGSVVKDIHNQVCFRGVLNSFEKIESALVSFQNDGVHPFQGHERLASLSESQVLELMQKLSDVAYLLAALKEQNASFRDEIKCLKIAISTLKLKVHESVFKSIGMGDVIEIYGMDFIQVYRSFSFMKYCGYSLLDLLLYQFPELYERSPYLTDMIVEEAKKVLASSDQSYHSLADIPVHVLRERFSFDRRLSLVDLKFATPVFNQDDSLFGFLVSQSIRKVKNLQNCPTVSFI